MKIKALKGFQYPTSVEVRNRIRRGEKVPMEDRTPWTMVEEGDVVDIPVDIEVSLLKRKDVAKREVANGS